MNQPIQWRKLGETGWKPGTLVDGISGNLAILVRSSPKTYLTMDRNGETRESASLGAWEGNYILSSSTPTVKITPNVVTYVLEVREQ